MTSNISIPDLHWYAGLLLSIPSILDSGSGKARCREIGTRIFDRFGNPGMVRVCEFVRDEFDRNTGSHIERAWDGIGTWLG